MPVADHSVPSRLENPAEMLGLGERNSRWAILVFSVGLVVTLVWGGVMTWLLARTIAALWRAAVTV
jgi:hypothetical protein